MIRIITRFQKVKFQTHRTGTCSVCGKRWKRSKTFSQTLNPFNRNAQGEVKTYSEIFEELREEARMWNPIHCEVLLSKDPG